MSERYNVKTWDFDEGSRGGWSYQKGLKRRAWNITILGVRRVLRELQRMGYQARSEDPSVLVEKISEA